MTTNSWLVYADTHDLPHEDIPILKEGDSGESYGWPSGLLGPQSTQRLDDLGVKTTSLLIQIANELDADQWKRVFGGKRLSCERSVWPTRYAGVQEFLQRLIKNKANASEYERRRRAALQLRDSSEASGRTTNAWAVFADTFKLPVEELPLALKSGEGGGSYGWPSGMMGKEALQRLHSKRITTTSRLIQMALSMDHDKFREEFGGNGNVFPIRFAGAHLYLVRCVTANPDNAEDYRKRIASQGVLAPVRDWFRKNSIPEGLGFTAMLFVAAMIAAALFNDVVWSPIASFVILSVGLFMITLQSLGRCVCFAAYAVMAHTIAAFITGSSSGFAALLVCIYVFVDLFAKVPSFLIPSFLR